MPKDCAPAGGATAATGRKQRKSSYFYSRPCGRGDSVLCKTWPRRPISTHAPAGGATIQAFNYLLGFFYFYSRPCGRGDRRAGKSNLLSPYFYSRPCGRGDVQSDEYNTICIPISTHAPAGGATGRRSCWSRAALHFYSRPCGRGDPQFTLQESYITETDFYSRPCGRGDRDASRVPAHDFDFYSRPCGRGDVIATPNAAVLATISTHAPAGGATETPSRSAICCTISTHAPAGGATHPRIYKKPPHLDFYSRPCGRGDMVCIMRLHTTETKFLLTPLREGRQQFSTSPS